MAEATAQDANLALQQAVARTWVAAQSMVRALAATGSPLYEPTVQTFQVEWNRAAAMLPSVSTGPAGSCKPGVRIPSLTEDGQYGPQTSTGLYLFAGMAMRSPPPCRAVDVPAWFGQNADMIASWVPPDAASDQVEIVGPSAAANTVLTAAAAQQSAPVISAQDAGGAGTQTIQQTTAVQPAATTSAPKASLPSNLCNLWTGDDRRRCKNQGFEKFIRGALANGSTVMLSLERPRTTTTRNVDPSEPLCSMWGDSAARAKCKQQGFHDYVRRRMLDGNAFKFKPVVVKAQPAAVKPAAVKPAPAPAPVYINVEEETPIVVARPEGKVPIIAIGVGVLALGGLLYAFTRPKRSHA